MQDDFCLPEFILKATGTFLTKYVLEDQDQQKVMLLNPDFNWAKFSYNYSISYAKKPQDILLVLQATYSAKYFIDAMSSGGVLKGERLNRAQQVTTARALCRRGIVLVEPHCYSWTG
jgi:hypothetical protein